MIPHKLENYYLYAKSKIQFNGKYNILENTVSCISNSQTTIINVINPKNENNATFGQKIAKQLE